MELEAIGPLTIVYSGLANYGLWPKLAHCLFLLIKLYWKTAMPIHLCIIYGCSHTAIAKSNCCNRDHLAVKSKIFIFFPLHKVIMPNYQKYQTKREKSVPEFKKENFKWKEIRCQKI